MAIDGHMVEKVISTDSTVIDSDKVTDDERRSFNDPTGEI